MNKTISVNIGGLPFIVDEDAHLMLRSYLNQIESRLTPVERREVMDDVESRIADIFSSQVNSRMQVIGMAQVRQAISIIGSADAFGDPLTQPTSNSTYTPPPQESLRKLTRSRADRVLAGVCGGIANFFGIDVTWIRIAAVLALFLGSLGFWLYIVLWIVIPEAPKSLTNQYNERR